MRLLVCLGMLLFVGTDKSGCNKQKTLPTGLYKARLEIKGICMNYTIKVLQGAVDTSLVAANWTDEMTGKSYTNVFALATPCSFPPTIQQGDVFTFRIDSSIHEQCAVCMAYYPKPQKRLSIVCTGQ